VSGLGSRRCSFSAARIGRGGLTISIGLGLVLERPGALDNSRSGLSWTTDLAVGGLALLVAAALATRALPPDAEPRIDPLRPIPTPWREPWTQRLLARGSVPVVFIAALAINLPGAACLVALKAIAAGHHPTGIAILLIARGVAHS
jgi:hypothetical protein